MKVTERGITILLDAVTSIGLLSKKDGKYQCPAELASVLSKKYPTSLTPMLMHAVGLWERWSGLTDIVRNGTGRTSPSIFDSSESEMEAFIGAMHVIGYRLAW